MEATRLRLTAHQSYLSILLILVLLTAVGSTPEAPNAQAQLMLTSSCRGDDFVAAERPSLDLLRWACASVKS